jgi:hypothetical protein
VEGGQKAVWLAQNQARGVADLVMVHSQREWCFCVFWTFCAFYVFYVFLPVSCFGSGDALFVVVQEDADHVLAAGCFDTVPLFLQTENNYALKLERPSHEDDIIVPLEHDIELFPDFE